MEFLLGLGLQCAGLEFLMIVFVIVFVVAVLTNW